MKRVVGVLISVSMIGCIDWATAECTATGTCDGGMSAVDAGARDSGIIDAGQADAGQADAGQPDAGQPDAGQPDAGQPDAGQPDAGFGCPSTFNDSVTVVDNTSSVSFNADFTSPGSYRLRLGTNVSFSGISTTHPLHQVCGPSLFLTDDWVSDSTFLMLPSTGVFGFECPVHHNRFQRFEVVP